MPTVSAAGSSNRRRQCSGSAEAPLAATGDVSGGTPGSYPAMRVVTLPDVQRGLLDATADGEGLLVLRGVAPT